MNREPAIQQDLSLSQIGQTFAQSGFFSDARNAAQALVKVMAGAEIGIPPVASMTGIHIIKGTVTIGAHLMAATLKRSGKYTYCIREHTAQKCALEFFERGESLGISEFTAEDARRTGTQNMQKFPLNMLFARALSNGVKWHCPDLFVGPVYTPEELSQTDENNQPIQALQPRQDTPPEPPPKAPNAKAPYFAYLDYCRERKKDLGEDPYYAILGAIGLEHSNEVERADEDRMAQVMQTLRQAVKDQKAIEQFDGDVVEDNAPPTVETGTELAEGASNDRHEH